MVEITPRNGKGLIRIFLIFSIKNRDQKLRFLAFPGGPGGFRELREAGRNHFHLSWYLLVPGITSYGPKPSILGGTFFTVHGVCVYIYKTKEKLRKKLVFGYNS